MKSPEENNNIRPDKKKTYLVTGAAGFIGARFVESCRKKGIETIAVDRFSHFETRIEHLEWVSPQSTEIVDRDALWSYLSDPVSAARISAVIHLGACANTMETDESFLEKVNVQYSQKLWEFAAQSQIPLIYASSAATYGDGSLGYDDDEKRLPELKPLNLYGWSKHRFDLWALAEDRLGRSPPAWAGFKFFNVYGFGERHKGPMASVILHAYEQIQQQGRIRLFRSHRPDILDGHQSRDFIAVEDVIDALHFATDHPLRRGIFNLGTGTARTYLDLALAVFRSLGIEPKIDFIDTPAPIRDKYQYFTESKMNRLRGLGYGRPFLPLEEGVKNYITRLSAFSV